MNFSPSHVQQSFYHNQKVFQKNGVGYQNQYHNRFHNRQTRSFPKKRI